MKMKLTVGLFLFMALFACQQKKSEVPSLQAGVSVAHINPSIGAFIAGDKQNRRFTAVHDSLYAKAVVITNGSERIAFVTLDCIGLLYPDVLRIRERTAALCDFPAERIIVTSTHTHSGPDVVGIWGSDYQHSGVDSVYMDFLVNTAATQVKLAAEKKQPVTVAVAQTTFGEPWVQNICNEEIDRTVAILHLRDSQGKAVATLTNFACHPTFMDAKFSEVSSDYVNGYYKNMKAQTGAEALFLQGAIGGWVQPQDGEGSFEKAYKRGSELADAVLAALPAATPLTSTAISFQSKQVKFPVENENWKQLSAIGTIKRNIQDSVTTELTWFSIGETQFVTHPGETAPYYGLECKKLMGDGTKFVIGLGNDALGYIVKPTFFEYDTIPHAPYLTSMSVGKQTGPLMMNHFKSLIPKPANE
jgi:hypothetical protein